MSKNPFLLLLGLLAAKNVFGLKCYVTEEVTKSGKVTNFYHKKHDCEDEIKGTYFANATLKCFKMVAGGPDTEVVIKGCMVKDECNLMKDIFLMMPYQAEFTDAKCYECDEDGCNVAPRSAAFGSMALMMAPLAVVKIF